MQSPITSPVPSPRTATIPTTTPTNGQAISLPDGLAPYRLVGDAEADAFLAKALLLPQELYPALQAGGQSLIDFVQAQHPSLWAAVCSLPASGLSIQSKNTAKSTARQAKRIFHAHKGDFMLLLGLYSLPYCYAAAAGSRVLELTQRLHTSSYKRLSETGRFVFDIMEDDDAIGTPAILQVRIIHALVRYHVGQHPDWDSAKHGLPVNQEDMAGTNLAFGYIACRGFRRMGGFLSPADQEAYLSYWRIVGHRLGVLPELLPATMGDSAALDAAIAQRQFAPSAAGATLTQALLGAFTESEAPAFIKEKAPMLMAYFLGPELATMLGLDFEGQAPDWLRLGKQLEGALGLSLTFLPAGQLDREARRHQISYK